MAKSKLTNNENRYIQSSNQPNPFAVFKCKFGSHKAAAAFLGVSYTRYNEWRWQPDKAPGRVIRMLEIIAEMIVKYER